MLRFYLNKDKGRIFVSRYRRIVKGRLKELKQPRLNVRVTADNAYVAQNQQVINTDEVNQTPKENH